VLVWRLRRHADGQRTKENGSLGGAMLVGRERHGGRHTSSLA